MLNKEMIYTTKRYSVNLSKISYVSCMWDAGGHLANYYSIYLDGMQEAIDIGSELSDLEEERNALVAAWKEYNTTVIMKD
jgi:CRISPR/Cas system-associated protein Csx1